ncbi:MAG: CapA family protein [Devosia sp.]
MKIVLAGECMIARPWSRYGHPAFSPVVDLLRGADVTYAHLETVIGTAEELEGPKSSDWTGSYLVAEPVMADELVWAGIDLVSAASNHSFDFGASGIRSTRRHCQAAGLACAGIGSSLEEARAPVYFEGPQGRIALVASSTGNKPYEVAGDRKGGIGARAGVNPLRVKTQYVVPADAAAQLKEIGANLKILRQGGDASAGHVLPGLESGEFRFGTPADQSTRVQNAFVEGDGYGTRNVCLPSDLAANLRVVAEASHFADHVIVAHHFNISDGVRGDAPPAFVRSFAHAAIDAGATIFVGHGWHRTMGIEIYKGRPIIYGIGNFVAHSEFMSNVPYDSYEAWGHDIERLPVLGPDLHPLHPGLDGPSETWWSSAIIEIEMEDGEPAQIRLVPVDLGRAVTADAALTRPVGRQTAPLTDGRPVLADDAQAGRILDRFERLSKPLGTHMRREAGVGVIDCRAMAEI